ncbi:MAG TPA: hypothetical protein VM764_05255 [Gemmatimonadaceae bacterium]|nr:hypothetical protein [Gemmatimonadaceae bacterium]
MTAKKDISTPVRALAPELGNWFDDHDQSLHDDLFEFLRIPSVSARSEHNADTARAAAWLHAKLAGIGFTTETLPTAGHPIVLAEWRGAPAGAPTVLVYGHYDVQRPSRSSSGTRRRSSRPSATATSTRAAASTTRDSSGCTSRRSRRTWRRAARCR